MPTQKDINNAYINLTHQYNNKMINRDDKLYLKELLKGLKRPSNRWGNVYNKAAYQMRKNAEGERTNVFAKEEARKAAKILRRKMGHPQIESPPMRKLVRVPKQRIDYSHLKKIEMKRKLFEKLGINMNNKLTKKLYNNFVILKTVPKVKSKCRPQTPPRRSPPRPKTPPIHMSPGGTFYVKRMKFAKDHPNLFKNGDIIIEESTGDRYEAQYSNGAKVMFFKRKNPRSKPKPKTPRPGRKFNVNNIKKANATTFKEKDVVTNKKTGIRYEVKYRKVPKKNEKRLSFYKMKNTTHSCSSTHGASIHTHSSCGL